MGNDASKAQAPGQAEQTDGKALHMKIVIKGDKKTGKTCLFNLLQKKRFQADYAASKVSQHALVDSQFRIGGIPVKFELWDTVEDLKGKSGGLKLATKQEPPKKHKSRDEEDGSGSAVPPPSAARREKVLQQCKNASAVIFLVDPQKPWTLHHVQTDVQCIPPAMPVLVIANFRDVPPAKNSVTSADIARWCGEERATIQFCEASMLNRFGVKAIKAFLQWPFYKMEQQHLMARMRQMDDLIAKAEKSFVDISKEQDYPFYKEWLDRTLKERMERSQGKGGAPTAAATSQKPPASSTTQPSHPPAQAKPAEPQGGGFFSKIKSMVSKEPAAAPAPAAKKKKPVDPKKAIDELKKVAMDAKRGKVEAVNVDDFDPTAVNDDGGYDDFFGSDSEDDLPTGPIEERDEVEENPFVQADDDIAEDDFIAAANKGAGSGSFYSDDEDAKKAEAKTAKPSKAKRKKTGNASRKAERRKVVVAQDSSDDEALNPLVTGNQDIDSEDEAPNPWVAKDADIDSEDEAPNPLVAGNQDIDSEDEAPNPWVAKDADIDSEDESPNPLVAGNEDIDSEDEAPNPWVTKDADIDSEDETPNPLVAGDVDIDSDDDAPNPLVAADGDIDSDDETPNPLVAGNQDIDSDDEASNPFVAADADIDSDDEGPNPLVAGNEDIDSDNGSDDGNPLVAGFEDIDSGDEGPNPLVADPEDIESGEEVAFQPSPPPAKKIKQSAPADSFSAPDVSGFSGFAATASADTSGFFSASQPATSASSFFGGAPEESKKSDEKRRRRKTERSRKERDPNRPRRKRPSTEAKQQPPERQVSDSSVYML